jgi:hypothetical protein
VNVRAAVLAIASVVWATSAVAADGPADEQRVAIALCAENEKLTATREVLLELLSRHSVEGEITSLSSIDFREAVLLPARDEDALAYAWVDFCREHLATLVLVDHSGERLLVRRVNLEPAHFEAAREELANVLEVAVENLLEGRQLSLTREQAQAQLVDVLPPLPLSQPALPLEPVGARARNERPHAGRTGWRPELEVGYELERFSEALAWRHGPAAQGSVFPTVTHLTPLLALKLAMRMPATARTDPIGATLYGFQALAAAGGQYRGESGWLVRATLGAGPDVTRVSPSSSGAESVLAAESFSAVGIEVRAELQATFPVGSLLSIVGGLYAATDPTGAEYLVKSGSERLLVLHPFGFRPGATLGVAIRP